MNTEQIKAYAKEVALIATVMGDFIMKKLYDKQGGGYILAVDTISDWALEFYEKHKDTVWEEFLETKSKPLSSDAQFHGFMSCWDDVVMDYAQYKFENL